MIKKLKESSYFPVLMFLLLYGIFYGFSQFTIGITSPGGGFYSQFIDTHLNWFAGLRAFFLNTSAAIIRFFGYTVTVYLPYRMKITDGAGVVMVHSCVGTAILSFWWAMILGFPQTLANKIKYFVAGTLSIFILNLARIAGVAMILSTPWGKAHRNIDHHLLFNLVVYGFLFLMLYKWFNIKDPKAQKSMTQQQSITQELQG
jgi:exosortase/archaeosortase family protein